MPGHKASNMREIVVQPVGYRIGYVGIVWIILVIAGHTALEFGVESVEIGGGVTLGVIGAESCFHGSHSTVYILLSPMEGRKKEWRL